MTASLNLGDLEIHVVLKDIKNVHLGVYPPAGRVRIAAPRRTDMETLRLFAISKLGWIRQQQRKLREQERETPRDFVERESHYVWGKRYLLTVVEADSPPGIELHHRRMQLRVRPGTDATRRATIVESWQREQVRTAATDLIARWEPRLGVTVGRFYVRRMKTRWGSCNSGAGTIRLNTDLARKPRECLEYIVVHELIHLLEPTHNERFMALMNHHLPDWKHRRQILNRLPVRHEDWSY